MVKSRFTNLDIVAILPELNQKLRGLRVNQIYDIDHKTYLIRFNPPTATSGPVDSTGKLVQPSSDLNEEAEEDASKTVLLIESGMRIHTTTYKWPKNPTPTGFTMKLRKHLKNKRLEYIHQLGVDRILDLQFGSKEAAYHVIVELYDRGNILITDHEFTILNILRPRKVGTEDEDVKFLVREKYPIHLAQTSEDYRIPTVEEIKKILDDSSPGDTLRKLFVPRSIFGPPLLESCFIDQGIPENVHLKKDPWIPDGIKVRNGLIQGSEIFKQVSGKEKNPGIIIANQEERMVNVEKLINNIHPLSGTNPDPGNPETIRVFKEFHPYLFTQHKVTNKQVYIEYESFDSTVDLFFSSMEGQKIDQKVLQAEREALKKLDRVKEDHQKRILQLEKAQANDERKAQLIEMNCHLVDKAINFLKKSVDNGLSLDEINTMLKEARDAGIQVAQLIKGIDMKNKSFLMELTDPYEESEDTTPDQNDIKPPKQKKKWPERISIDMNCTAYSNARKYFERKKVASTKEQKTIKSSGKALKSAQVKTNKLMKEVAIKASITKSRKIYWFEKFNWFISSENYLVIGGKDAGQNEVIVKRYLKPGDIYVHADLHGGASVVVKNNYSPGTSGTNGDYHEIPPKTISEAAVFAVAYSSAWEAKISSRSWWVRADQVSKTAPSGEYLTLGSFMIRGKKNYLPMPQLQLAFGFLFKLDDESIQRHVNERAVKTMNEELEETIQKHMNERTVKTMNEEIDETIQKHMNERTVKTMNEELEETIQKHMNERTVKTMNEEIGSGVKKESAQEESSVVDTVSEQTEIEVSSSDDESAREESPEAFPDTKIRTISLNSEGASSVDGFHDEDDEMIIVNPSEPKVKQQSQKRELIKQKMAEKLAQEREAAIEEAKEKAITDGGSKPLSLRQRHKMKKIKEKYKDQDEEERQLRMALLGHDERGKSVVEGNKRGGKKGGGKKEKRGKDEKLAILADKMNKIKLGKTDRDEKLPETPGEEGKLDEEVPGEGEQDAETPCGEETNTVENDVEEEARPDGDAQEADEEEEELNEVSSGLLTGHVNLLNSLTGQPMPEDHCLFSIPVVGPSTPLSSYKFKVNVLPGTHRRGKLAKTALHLFIMDKYSTQREKDLLKATKDQDIARNLPKSIKITTATSVAYRVKKNTAD